MLFFGVSWGLICLMVGFSQQKSDVRKLYEKKGNLSIMAIFNNRFGNKCNEEVERGLEEITSAIWTVEALNNYHYLPGITIGLSIFGICESSHKNLSVLEDKRFNEEVNYLGILTTPEVHNILLISNSFVNKNIVHIEHVINSDMLVDATVQLLLNLNWMNVNVISDSASILKSFEGKASGEGIFTHDKVLMNSSNFSTKLNKSKISPVVVVIAKFGVISNLDEKLQDENIKLILTPTDFFFDVTSLDLPKNTIISLPSMGSKAVLFGFMKNALDHNDFFTQKPPTKGPLFVEIAASILKFLKPIKRELGSQCQKGGFYYKPSCIDFMNIFRGNKTYLISQKSMKITPDDVEETLKVLKIEPSSNDEMFLYITSVVNANMSEDIAIFQIFNLKTKSFQPVLTIFKGNSLSEIMNKSEIKTEHFDRSFRLYFNDIQARPSVGNSMTNLLQKFVGDFKIFRNEQFENITYSKHSTPQEKSCESEDVQSHMCSPFAINHTPATPTNTTMGNNFEVGWRFLTWVSINTSLGFVGVMCTLSTLLFIFIRLCKDHMLESSPNFTLLLMIFVIFTYVSSLPFHLDFIPNNWFICWYRKNGPPMVFAGLFSLLLSRSLVIALVEGGREFENYLKGYLQSILCFFMIGVQISLISQNWLLEKDNYNLNCENGYDKYKIFYTLGYDFLLLFLLACVSPFIVRSKQNYKEGLLFSISTFFITVVWSAWISFYVLLPDEHKAAAVAIGLNSTASVFLFCIFIPQTYFMTAPYDQERTLRTLSSFNRNILTDLSTLDFKSNRTLNHTGFGTITFKNSDMGLPNPSYSTSRSVEGSNNPVRTDNFTNESVIDVDSPEDSQQN